MIFLYLVYFCLMETISKKEDKNTDLSSVSGASLIENMFKAGAHFGFSRTRRHPTFKPILFGSKNAVDVINLEKTSAFLIRAMDFVRSLAQKGKIILFVGTKPEGRRVVQETALELNIPSVTNRWIGGTLTNLPEIRKRVARLEGLQQRKEKGELGVYTKKEQLEFDIEIEKLTEKFGGITALLKLPDAIFVLDTRHEHTAVEEARKKHIPIVALAGSDCDLSEIDFPIPANDTSLKSIKFFVGKIAEAIKEGKKAAQSFENEESPQDKTKNDS